MDEKDRFGQKIHDREKAHEDQWARQRDQELLDKLRKHPAELHCPQCHALLKPETVAGLAVMRCAHGHGGWLDHENLAKLTDRK
ncbi:MAG TPA: zf-TFIIB domain-containing protein [Candidatus Binataceae bacterium]|nr:zf-TFIIB domain-containing protein [Candidatus Binataceae bacterium]